MTLGYITLPADKGYKLSIQMYNKEGYLVGSMYIGTFDTKADAESRGTQYLLEYNLKEYAEATY